MIFDAEKKEAVTALFEKYNDQADVLVGIYKMVFPAWDNIEKIDGWPKCGKPLWIWVCDKFMDFDKKYHPHVFSGGIWMNNGFSVDESLGDFEVSTEGVTLTMKE